MRLCPECKEEVLDQDVLCPNCGAQIMECVEEPEDETEEQVTEEQAEA